MNVSLLHAPAPKYVCFCLYHSKECSMCNLLHSNAVHKNCWEELSNSVQKVSLLPAPSSSYESKTLAIYEMLKNRTGLGTPRAPNTRADSPFLLPPALKPVPEESRCQVMDFLLHHTEHAKTAISYISLQDNESASIKTTRIWSTSFRFSIIYGEYVFWFQILTSDLPSDNCILHVSVFGNRQNALI